MTTSGAPRVFMTVPIWIQSVIQRSVPADSRIGPMYPNRLEMIRTLYIYRCKCGQDMKILPIHLGSRGQCVRCLVEFELCPGNIISVRTYLDAVDKRAAEPGGRGEGQVADRSGIRLCPWTVKSFFVRPCRFMYGMTGQIIRCMLSWMTRSVTDLAEGSKNTIGRFTRIRAMAARVRIRQQARGGTIRTLHHLIDILEKDSSTRVSGGSQSATVSSELVVEDTGIHSDSVGLELSSPEPARNHLVETC
jgi:hypothetical protein